jgi:predicted RNA-binding protein with EMAP domain
MVKLSTWCLMSRDQNVGRSHSIKTDNISFERVEQFKYLRTLLNKQNCIQEEIKKRLKSGNACYLSVQNLLSSILLEDMKNKVYRIIVLRIVSYGYETWWLIMREERRLRPFVNRVLS